MIMKSDFVRALDPRRSYLPAPRAPEATSRITEHADAPTNRTLHAMTNVSALSLAGLRAEIERREKASGQLQARREKLVAELAALDWEIAAMGGKPGAAVESTGAASTRKSPGPRGPRAKNTVSLADALAMAVEPRAVISPAEAAELVTANGYISTGKNLGMIVANALAKDARFKRIGRGQYERVE